MRSADEGSTVLYTVCAPELSSIGHLTIFIGSVRQLQTWLAYKQLIVVFSCTREEVASVSLLIMEDVLHIDAH
jgi:hypothetical protein